MSEYIKKEDVYQILNIVTCVGEIKPSVAEIDIEAFESIPAEDVEPVVRGEWKLLVSKWDRETDILLLPRNECSVCHKWVECYKNYNFCPSCGAHMERSGSGE